MIFTKSYIFPKYVVPVVVSFLMVTSTQAQELQLNNDDGDVSSSHGNETGEWQTFALPETNTQKSGNNSKTKAQSTNTENTQVEPLKEISPAVTKQQKQPEKPKESPKKSAKPSNIIRIISSTIDNSALVMANDLARHLDQGKTLRIVPIIGKGTAQSLKDLYYLKGVDIGIIQADVLQHYKKNKKLPDPDRFIRYISALGTQEVHIIARKNIKSLKELRGRSVNIGPVDGGTAITANAVFKSHNIEVNSVHMENRAALARLKTGAIDAVIIVGGKPDMNMVRDLAITTEFHLLDIGFNKELEKHYAPTVMIHEDYPYLIKKDGVVSSITVDMIMAMYYWPKGTPRHAKVKRFVDTLFSRIHELKGPLFHPKWQEVRINHDVKGWKRFKPAAIWLSKNKKLLKKYSHLPKTR